LRRYNSVDRDDQLMFPRRHVCGNTERDLIESRAARGSPGVDDVAGRNDTVTEPHLDLRALMLLLLRQAASSKSGKNSQ
jgi:hypothetical protein